MTKWDGTQESIIRLDHKDRVQTPQGRCATVEMVFYDRYYTGDSPDLVRLVFDDGGTPETVLSIKSEIGYKISEGKEANAPL